MTLTKLEALYNVDHRAYMKVCEAAFELVKPMTHWKAPIKTTASKAALKALGFEPAVVAHAVAYYTATECKVTETATEITFEAAGYWAGPAN